MKNLPQKPKLTLVLTLILISTILFTGLALAAPNNSITLTAVQDTYTDLNFPSTNFDEGLLNVANSMGPPGGSDVTTKYVFLEFDLSGLGIEVKEAQLSLSTLTCDGIIPVDEVEIVIYGVDNASDWVETLLTWDTQPAISTGQLAALDAGSLVENSAFTYTWTDMDEGAFSTWLESQRTANDGSATLVLAIENSGNPGIAEAFFEDSETSGANYGCSDSLGIPTLQISNGIFSIFLPLLIR